MSGVLGCSTLARTTRHVPEPTEDETTERSRAAHLPEDLTIEVLFISAAGGAVRPWDPIPRLRYLVRSHEEQERFAERVEQAFGVTVQPIDFRREAREAAEPHHHRSSATPHLRMFLVRTSLGGNIGSEIDLSVVALPAASAESGGSLTAYDDYVFTEGTIVHEGVEQPFASFEIDRALYPGGSRRYVYSRKLEFWEHDPDGIATAADSLLTQLLTDLSRDGFPGFEHRH
jgi:hypothetical protein